MKHLFALNLYINFIFVLGVELASQLALQDHVLLEVSLHAIPN